MRSIILFGSEARNDSTDTSDIDLLLISHGEVKRRDVEQIIPTSLLPKGRKLGLSIYSEEQLISAYEEGSLFMMHLLKEGKVLYDDGFYEQLLLTPFNPSERKMRLKLKMLKQRLEIAEDLQKFNNLFIVVLGDFFSISKNLAYVLLAMNGHFIFNKKKAFLRLAETYPEYEEGIRKLQSLEPFFLRKAKGIVKPLPFSPKNCEDKVVEMRECIKELIVLGEEKDG